MEIHTRRFGDVEIVQIVETDIDWIFAPLIPALDTEAVRRVDWLRPPFRDDEFQLRGVSQTFVLRVGERIVVVDTGVGNDKVVPDMDVWTGRTTDYLDGFARAGIALDDVTDVICTHLHIDHVGWNTRLVDGSWVPTFPRATYHFVREEHEHWAHDHDSSEEHGIQALSFEQSVSPVVDAGRVNFVAIDADLGDGIRLVPTPGHTLAHACVLVDAGDETFLIAGDAMHHPVQIAYPEWGTLADMDQDASGRTRRELFERYAGTDVWIAGTHFSSPSFGRIVRDGEGYAFAPIED